MFGDLDDPESAVSRLSRSSRGSKLLEDLGTQPKVTYLEAAQSHEHCSRCAPIAEQINSDLLRPLLQTSWKFYALVAILGGDRRRRRSSRGCRRCSTASASPASGGRSTGASTSRASCSGSASATPAR